MPEDTKGTKNGKLKLGLYWAASCGGCEIAIVELREKILDLDAAADILFWPCAMDFKYKDVEAMPDGHIDVCLFNGAIRTSENEHVAHLLRQKSKVLVAFGSCAHLGGIPGLGNLFDRQSIFERAYLEAPSVDNPEGILPQTSCQLPEGEVTIPYFYNTVKSLAQVEDVDYFIPGCPPQAPQIWAVVEAILSGNLPPKGSVVGANEKTVCDECEHKREEKRIKKFYRPHEIIPDHERCLFDQGIICAGPATRGGCGALCPSVDMPCRGCYGPPPNVIDQGAALLSAVASVVDADTEEEAARIVGEIVDPVGTFYRFGLPASLLHRSKLEEGS
ncbi:MAG: oxidoreductase [Chloroflexi bacterium]|nr:MAG: oxidoreductase [Chloroflexota bacterium]